MSPAERAFSSLGTTRARNIILVMLLIYALLIGALMMLYVNIASCVSDYANKSAISTNARAQAAAEDRKLDQASVNLQESDRKANREFSRALSAVLRSFGESEASRKTAYQELLLVDEQTSKVLDDNADKRNVIRLQRLEIEKQRAANPPPPPPSETC